MEKIDELIDALADHIKKRIDEGNDLNNEITEKTKALAELVSARALAKNNQIKAEAFKKEIDKFQTITGKAIG